MSKDLKLVDLEAAEYVEQMREKIITPMKRPIHAAFFSGDIFVIKQKLLGYYFWIEDIYGNCLASMSFDHTLEEVSQNIEYHKLLVLKVQDMLARMSDQNLTVFRWPEQSKEVLDREYPGTCII